MKKTEPMDRPSKRAEVRPLTTDERASFVILSFYMAAFCICTFLFLDSLVLRILGVTSGAAGLFLFVAAFFNTERPEKGHSIHPLRSYLFSLFTTLVCLFLIRFVAGMIGHTVAAVIVAYGGLLVSLVVLRKAVVQVVSALLVLTFLFVVVSHRGAVLAGDMKFKNVVRQCGQLVLQMGPIQNISNLLLTGSYMSYLSRIDYRDDQINILAIRTVADSGDDEIRKTVAILNFVSNEIYYISDPNDGIEHVKDPITTLIAGGGDCEDQTLLLCSMLESVGVKTYIAFTDDHVFALVRFSQEAPELSVAPYLWIEGRPCYVLEAADPGAILGWSATVPGDVKQVFDVRGKFPAKFSLAPE